MKLFGSFVYSSLICTQVYYATVDFWWPRYASKIRLRDDLDYGEQDIKRYTQLHIQASMTERLI